MIREGARTRPRGITGVALPPRFFPPTGEGAAGHLWRLNDFVTAASGDSIGSIYRFCRVPTNAQIKPLSLSSLVTGAGAGDIRIAYSDSLFTRTNHAFAGIACGVIHI